LRVARVTAKWQVERVLFAVHAGQCIDSDRESDGGKRRRDLSIEDGDAVALSCLGVEEIDGGLC
jgi:hypothetical protein